jgi:hypothetical protein
MGEDSIAAAISKGRASRNPSNSADLRGRRGSLGKACRGRLGKGNELL